MQRLNGKYLALPVIANDSGANFLGAPLSMNFSMSSVNVGGLGNSLSRTQGGLRSRLSGWESQPDSSTIGSGSMSAGVSSLAKVTIPT